MRASLFFEVLFHTKSGVAKWTSYANLISVYSGNAKKRHLKFCWSLFKNERFSQFSLSGWKRLSSCVSFILSAVPIFRLKNPWRKLFTILGLKFFHPCRRPSTNFLDDLNERMNSSEYRRLYVNSVNTSKIISSVISKNEKFYDLQKFLSFSLRFNAFRANRYFRFIPKSYSNF